MNVSSSTTKKRNWFSNQTQVDSQLSKNGTNSLVDLDKCQKLHVWNMIFFKSSLTLNTNIEYYAQFSL